MASAEQICMSIAVWTNAVDVPTRVCTNARPSGGKPETTMAGLHIVRADVAQAEAVASLIAALLSELSGAGQKVAPAALLPTARTRLLCRATFFAYLATDAAQRAAGVITVSTGVAIYAAGIVATIQEFYVEPGHRSAGLGRFFLSTLVECGRAAGWNRIEVGAPSAERWQRTIDFYRANGFTEIGPRLQLRLAA